ncbi:bifunctional diaminohydroxyphosphoribosylaminopyrimidine deaminase/5-amino-6-(5-phosphoribosylamino)uracil reductase RibD [Rhizobium sp. BG4]|uniref:bifunctional diaminohydroxyphosphoribosylaminopyrimidine deaminase/5-amino-6-(5-phosphoribosylamino)uracil reductase RibD n=1 Tax=Rhizobium sp. BG4 TaxID=2613770 RepID=UPI00193CBF53|nr:bifunctional diaminohydroxyphosphoribosylaminopyrimidine deaminase/5-amino-6-(5-phosphoribosylamino)uracil reductase RibD [Rhizobium sp. BG4]QRM42383.1 bifunctional diaminohydroxyphosphoribosylaminopyrimidine deaminase/5-amino-6-(5-phosphoribosylamino)uracil reductase RibD [Rhizobium sp. BG4]
MTSTSDDERYMAEAISLGLLHLGQTSTNPSVGCVVVKDGEIVGRGTTAVGGRPHAEPQALAEAGERAEGATAYVTLEPCSHFGKTPPCANALIASGVARVVISVTDPDERVSGRGIGMLRDAGIKVDIGVLEDEGRRSLAAYLTRQTKKRPYVTLKLAVSADGMIGRRGDGQVAITGPAARAEVQKLRAQSDAILVGIGTAIADDPELTVRIARQEDRSPVRIVLDPALSLPVTGKLARTARQVPVIVVAREEVSDLAVVEGSPPSALPGISPTRGRSTRGRHLPKQWMLKRAVAPSQSPPCGGDARQGRGGNPPTSTEDDLDSRRTALEALGVEVLYCNPYHPEVLLPALASRGISSLIVEGGARTAKLFLDTGLVDRIQLYQGDVVIGADGIESPVTKTDMPSGFAHRGTFSFGSDRMDEYEREL